MDMTKAFLAAALAGLTVVAGHVAAQGTPPQTPPAGLRRRLPPLGVAVAARAGVVAPRPFRRSSGRPAILR